MYIIKPIISKTKEKDKETLVFASYELQKYLAMVTDEDISVVPVFAKGENKPDTIYLFVNENMNINGISNPELDDAIEIEIKGKSGIISGTNARSVLIGVYRYLKELGFAFIRPGKDGEYCPDDFKIKDVSVLEKASYRHRSVCIEGSVFQENLMDIIDWIPKASMNGYFMQFQIPRVFFDRWYLEDTPYREKLELTNDEILSIVSLAEDEIQKRSLMYHSAGHGWTCQAVGIDGTAWEKHEEPEEKYRYRLALVNGERKLWDGIPLNTNLCYSNPEVRDIVTDNIIEYCKAHQGISYLHFWLGDAFNNCCECENCRNTKVSDYYVMMLNELDEKLTKENMDTRIGFLLYFDLLWKPDTEKIKNKDRFVLMFAPITRSYSSSYCIDVKGETKPYEYNKIELPKDVGENLAYLKEWQKDFDGDSFDFDYHFMWDHYYDFPQYNHAKILSGDIKNLDKIGLDGLVSCQIQRAFLPTSLSMNTMAETLWNKDADFDDITVKTLKREFGSEYGFVIEYLSYLSDNGCAKALREEEKITSPENIASIEKSLNKIGESVQFIEEQINSSKDIQIKNAWEKLRFFSVLYKEVLLVYKEVASGNKNADISRIKDIALKNENRFRDEFDAMYFMHTFILNSMKRILKQ